MDALQTSDKHNVATPANWKPGDPVVVPAPKTQKKLKNVSKKGTTARFGTDKKKLPES